MRRIMGWLLLCMVFNITSCTNASPTQENRASNFAFVLRDRACLANDVDVLDTAKVTLAYTPLGETTSITVPLQLTDDELDQVYQKITTIDFF